MFLIERVRRDTAGHVVEVEGYSRGTSGYSSHSFVHPVDSIVSRLKGGEPINLVVGGRVGRCVTVVRVADDFMRRLAAAIRGAQLYSPGHPLVARALGALAESCSQLLADESSITVGIVGQDVVVGDLPIPRSRETYGELTRRLKRIGIERISFDRGIEPDEIATLVQTISHPERAVGRTAPGAAPSDPTPFVLPVADVLDLPDVSVAGPAVVSPVPGRPTATTRLVPRVPFSYAGIFLLPFAMFAALAWFGRGMTRPLRDLGDGTTD